MDKKIFCGIGAIPKNSVRGSMKDCLEKGQIRYFGVKKIDSRLLEKKDLDALKNSKKKQSLFLQWGLCNEKVKKLRKEIMNETSETKIVKKKIQLDKAIEKLSKLAKLNQAEEDEKEREKKRKKAMQKQKRSSRKRSSSRKRTSNKKKTTTKRTSKKRNSKK